MTSHPDAALTSTFTRVGELTLHAEVAGPVGGRPMVMVPGLAVSTYLRPTQRALAVDGWRVWRLDLPGYGRSPRPPRSWRSWRRVDLVDLADLTADWLDAVGVPSVDLLGHSMGTQVGAHVAARHADRVRGLVLAGPVVDPAYPRAWRLALRWLRDAGHEPPSLLARQAPEWLRTGPRRVAATMAATLRDPFPETLDAVRSPVLVVRGRHDRLSTPSWARSLADGPGRTYVEVAGAHCGPYALPREYARVIGARLRDVPAG